MLRLASAMFVALGLVACSGGNHIDAKDPWAALTPWNPEREGLETTENGVQYVVIKKGPGAGDFPRPQDEVEVHYAGRLAVCDSAREDKCEFDSSYERGETTSFRLNQVIPGWTEGLQKMQVGDQFMFFIPSAMGYGARGAGGGEIPPDADLLFRVELFKIIPALVPDEAAWAKATPWPTDSKDIIRTPSGLEYMVIESGPADALRADENDNAVVHFEGRLDDGLVADSTFESQRPEYFPIDRLVPGWAETLQTMRKGDRWMVRIPPHLMYAEDGYGRVPPNAAVTFEINLMDVVKIDPPAAMPAADGDAPSDDSK